jgi:1A family penicillin-binding protein
MDSILVKIFATALALSQILTKPDDVKTQFDPLRDRAEVVRLLQAGCAHLKKSFAVESVNIDDLIATAMNDPKAAAGTAEATHGLKFDDLFASYRQFCKNEPVAHAAVDLGEVIAFYNEALIDLPDPGVLKGRTLPSITLLLDQGNNRFAEIGRPEHRRIWVPLSDIPDQVQKAFVAAEDKRFFEHHGVDERGMIRAFIGNLTRVGRMQGGSTITQQVVKNLLVGDSVTFERKIREVVVASRLEHTLNKGEILTLYLNSVYLGRGSWGVEKAARAYFGKHAKDLTLAEGAVLAGLTRGPSYYGPDRSAARTRERLTYVLDRLQEDGAISAEQKQQAAAHLPHFIDYQRQRRDTGYFFVDQVIREAKSAVGIENLGDGGFTVHSTLVPELQRATEAALQDGLAQYELRTGRQQFQRPEANIADAVRRIEQERSLDNQEGGRPAPARSAQPAWQQAMESVRLPLYDVHWPAAVVLPTRRGEGLRAGLADGRILPLETGSSSSRRALKPYDVVYVSLGKESRGVAELRVRPKVQGAAIVIENRTGKILAMAGGFSYPLSQLNRATQVRRQPGSALKPVTYLAALKAGLQPNTLVLDEPITLAPPDGSVREENYWTPRNDSGSTLGAITLRRALENSRNLATAHLLDGGIAKKPKDSLDRVCHVAMAAQLYEQCEPYYPFVLGAQPVRVVDLAAFYAAIANEGLRPTPHVIESIDRNGQSIYQNQAKLAPIADIDPGTFYQLRSMLEGVVARGTARSIRHLARYVAGKTGTTTDVVDTWFVGFNNEVTVAVWVGYDNGDGQRRTLGDGQTGNAVAVPIFAKIMDAVWADIAPRAELRPPSPEARRLLVDLPIDLGSGERLGKGSRGFLEHFHLNAQGKLDFPRSVADRSRNDDVREERTVRIRSSRSHSASHSSSGRSSRGGTQQASWPWGGGYYNSWNNGSGWGAWFNGH